MFEGAPNASLRLPSPHLPPPELRLFNPKTDGLLPTPLDGRGLVDPNELVRLVKSTVEPDYRWPSSYNDVHHLQWPNRRYEYSPGADINPQEFRNLSISKLYVPRVFHNWTHHITEPPPKPSDEVMYHLIEAQRVAMTLFRTVRASKKAMRLKHISDDELESRLVNHFDTFNRTIEVARNVPPEFQVLDLSHYRADTYEDMFQLAPQLGRLAITSTVVRQVTLPVAV